MKIIIESHSDRFTIENDHDDVTMEEVVQLLRQLLVGAGYHASNVKDYLGEE